MVVTGKQDENPFTFAQPTMAISFSTPPLPQHRLSNRGTPTRGSVGFENQNANPFSDELTDPFQTPQQNVRGSINTPTFVDTTADGQKGHRHHHHHHRRRRRQQGTGNGNRDDPMPPRIPGVNKSLAAVLFGKRYVGVAYFTLLMTIIQSIVFLVELIKMGIYTKTVFQTKPYFNPMLGPSAYVEINLGARYTPCMTYIDGITDLDGLEWPCPNSTSSLTDVCSLNELCGMNGFKTPNQWYRMVTAIFVHAGFVHILFNFVLQVVIGWKVEQYIGLLRYAFIYMACGIAGFLLGSNFTPPGIASMGCSGALFGSCIAMNLLLLLLNQDTDHYGIKLKNRRSFYCYLVTAIVEILIMIVLGFLPGLDNFSHIGGFIIGIALGLALLNDPKWVYREQFRAKAKYPRDTFMGERYKNRFIIWTVLRVVMLVLTILYFVFLVLNFKNKGAQAAQSCKWCKYLNCIPVNGWCDQGSLYTTTD